MPALAFAAVLAAGSLTAVSPAASTAATHASEQSLVATLRDAGFEGQALRIAWAIVMRESRGNARSVSRTGDYGLFQINKATYGREAFWTSDALMRTPWHNAAVAFDLSQGGRTWYPWDIDGQGRHLARYSSLASYKSFRAWLAKAPVVAEPVIACPGCGMPSLMDEPCASCALLREATR